MEIEMKLVANGVVGMQMFGTPSITEIVEIGITRSNAENKS
jgi:hypothetical protein